LQNVAGQLLFTSLETGDKINYTWETKLK